MRDALKQPHEGVTGLDRPDYLLSLDDRALAHRDALIAMASHLSGACLVGDPAPIVERMDKRIRAPQPGDLVVEVSTQYTADAGRRIKGLGILLEQRVEWWETDAEWEAIKAEDGTLEDAERMTDRAWYIQYGPEPGDVCRWVNCQFTVIPTDPREFSMPVGRRDGTGVTITKGDLTAGLADSGFTLKSRDE